MSDNEIIELIKAGREDKALVKLYKLYPSIQRFLMNNGASKDEALDVYQDALYILCKKVKEGYFTLSAQLSTYLYSVCKLLWKQEQAKNSKTINISIDLPEEEQNNIAEYENKLTMAEQALENLGEKCIEILKAFYHQGMRMEKIAQVFGFSSEKVAKNQKYKCLERAKLKYAELANTNH
ncbi:MAG: sigma-70 family RNA polymerase sigma factor [Bacteroidetes bacterium]|nr:sigma-70 family RNA polymerase sigma factor [Bacteroidota bacterium]